MNYRKGSHCALESQQYFRTNENYTHRFSSVL